MHAPLPNRMTTAQYRALVAAGDISSAKPKRANAEEDLHFSCMEWVKLRRHPLLDWLVHVPNGGKRPKGEAGKLKAMGTKAGYPDFTLPRRSGCWNGLAIELKAPTGKGRVSPEQKEWLDMFSAEGWLVAVCISLDEFVAAIEIFLGGGNKKLLPCSWRPARL